VTAPATLPELQRRIRKYGDATGQPYDRVQRRVAAEVIFNVLELARQKGLIDSHVIKGGMALEIRFDSRARASKDLDISIPVPLERMDTVFDAILALGFDNFSLKRREQTYGMEAVLTRRYTVQIAYRKKALAVIDVDVTQATREPAVDILTTAVLPQLGLPGPISVPLLEEATQLAHKIHGATYLPSDSRPNERFRDAIDALLIFDSLSEADLERVRAICRREFTARKMHVWPPQLPPTVAYGNGLVQEAVRNNYPITREPHLRALFLRMLARIEGVPMQEQTEQRILSIPSEWNFSIQSNGEPNLAADSALARALSEGWRIAEVFTDRALRMFAILERPLVAAADQRSANAPILQLRLAAQDSPSANGPLWMTGFLSNAPQAGAAYEVRVHIPLLAGNPGNATQTPIPIGSLTPGERFDLRIEYGQAPLASRSGTEKVVIVEYRDGLRRKFQQTGQFLAPASINNRDLLVLRGLSAGREIDQFSVKYDPNDPNEEL
jgi:Nucleotidyl transferase AbiEii toxin, Type IV TA system